MFKNTIFLPVKVVLLITAFALLAGGCAATKPAEVSSTAGNEEVQKKLKADSKVPQSVKDKYLGGS